MGLPTVRELTFAGNTPIPSAVLNAIQDAIIGKKYPAGWRAHPIARGWVETNIAALAGGAGGVGATADVATIAQMPVYGYDEGTRITGLKAQIIGNAAGTGNIDIWLDRVNGTGNSTNIGHITAVAVTNVWQTVTLDPIGTIITLAAGQSLMVTIAFAKNLQACQNFSIKSDRL